MTQPAPTLLQMMRQLIGTASISSVSPEFDQSNRDVIDLMANWLNTLGFTVEVLPLASQPHKANLIATLGKGPGGLVLSGHTDTVPYDEGQWNNDPFKLTEADNRLYGLGTSDMKGFFALAIEAARHYQATDMRQPLIILATADEESSMDGAKELVRLGRPKARYAVIGEPTGLRPIHMHKGIIMEAVHVHGHSGHSSNPALGANALEGMHKVLGDLLAWRDELQAQHIDHRFAVPVPTLNLGHIHGGDNPNRICGHCELHFDLRPLPGMDLGDLRHDLDKRLTGLLAGSALRAERQSLIDGTDPMHTPVDSAIVQAAERLTGHPAEAVAFCTEGPYLNALGMDSIILGPGDIAQAHQPDEYLALDRIQPTVDLLQQLIERFCIQPQR
ncbi:acetylornithine deacetylase [Sulfuriflexus mobilis]|uniref:acetylornithine deacetylase n=1 Tax=Sulfuriflexus mobilis TaxID=1811807 RepID=UPI000F8271A2|nr:acetylornithine deacetylase [Sulfuriflexus mobilis]